MIKPLALAVFNLAPHDSLSTKESNFPGIDLELLDLAPKLTPKKCRIVFWFRDYTQW